MLGAHEELRSSGEAEPQLPDPAKSDPVAALAELEEVAAAARGHGNASQCEKVEAAHELAAARGERLPSVAELQAVSFESKRAELEPYVQSVAQATKAVAEHGGGRETYEQIRELVRIFAERFREAKEERSGLDFEDLQLTAVGLLRGSTGLRESYSARFKHLLIDEFQDTNAVQLELVELLRGPQGSVFFVGDEFQSIYGFRHADIEVFRREREVLRSRPDGAVLPLSGNFRSRPEVISTANALGELLLSGFRELTVGSSEQAEGEPAGGGCAVELLLTEQKGWDELDLQLPVDDRTPINRVAEARFLASGCASWPTRGCRPVRWSCSCGPSPESTHTRRR